MPLDPVHEYSLNPYYVYKTAIKIGFSHFIPTSALKGGQARALEVSERAHVPEQSQREGTVHRTVMGIFGFES